ncbi:MAG: hypothetical protein MJ145_03150 [Clostridia bacterium]|nr:hypothetical protein [Clostridia bacterium]
MSLNRWKDNKIVFSNLNRAIINDHLHHAYIVESDIFTDKMAFAKDMIKAIVCEDAKGIGCDTCIHCHKINHGNYEDLYIVDNEGSIKDEDINALQNFLLVKANEGDRKFAIINKADTMTEKAKNRLLKTLEEPNPGTMIILLSENVENLLDTIRSRCVMFRLNPSGTDELMTNGETMEKAKALIEILSSDAYFHRALQEIGKGFTKAEEVEELLETMERVFRDELFDKNTAPIKKEELFKDIQHIEKAKSSLRYNARPIYVLKEVLLKIGG